MSTSANSSLQAKSIEDKRPGFSQFIFCLMFHVVCRQPRVSQWATFQTKKIDKIGLGAGR